MEQEVDLRAYLNILKRRYLYLLLPAAGVFMAVVAIAYLLPPVYQARATILVESQQIPSELAQSTVTGGAIERIKVIEQRLTTRDNLLEIVRTFDLFSDDGSRQSPTEIVDEMRTAINIEQIEVGPQRAQTTVGFTITFDYGDPTNAARVANELVRLILEQNIRARTGRASETNRFFVQRVERLEQDLVAMEARIVAFKDQNRDALPETLVYRQTQQVQIRGQIDDIGRRIEEAQAQLQLWRQRLAANPDGAILDQKASDTELDRLRTQLVQVRALYADGHPEVRKIVAQINALEAASDASSPQPTEKSPADSVAATATDASGTGGNNQIALYEGQLNLLLKQRDAAVERAAALDRAIARTPQVEVELAALSRDYESVQALYLDAQIKMAAAETGEQLEEDRQAERFEVLEQANTATEPVSPNRPRIIMAGSFGSIAVGVGFVMLLELLDKSIRSAADLERRLQIRPIAVIPYVTTLAERQSKKRLARIALLGAIGLLILGLVAVQAFYYPIDYMAERLLNRFGI